MLLASHTTLQGDLERGAVLVAITTSSRRAKSSRARPTISSLVPSE